MHRCLLHVEGHESQYDVWACEQDQFELTMKECQVTNPLVVVTTEVENGEPVARGLWLWCPGCDLAHRPRTHLADGTPGKGTTWDWNGRTDEGFTISPSLLVHTGKNGDRCHSFIRDGHWQFLDDCTHKLKGQTVPMVPVPDWLAGREARRDRS